MAALWGSDWPTGWLDDGARKRSRSVWARCFRQPHRTDRLRRTAHRLEDRHMEHVHANAEFGTIASTPEKSLIKDISGVITSTFGLSATRSFGAGRALQVSLSQPLRVESGRASFVVPVARTKSGSVVRRSFTSGLSPSGRQIDFSLSWHHRVSDRSRVHLSGILTHNPGHRANAKPEAALLLGWKHSF